ncbi:MAG: ATP-binding protein [Beijerinckiaceae bacterium]
MTALGKLFRTTAFKLSLVYLAIFAVGAGIVLGGVGWNVKALIDEQIAQTVDADIRGLSEQYAEGGIRQLVEVIQRRTRQPSASLYLVTTYAGVPVAGNVAALPEQLVAKSGLVEASYQRAGETTARHRALARVFVLPGGFRLLVGHDIEDRESLRKILGRALVTSLVWLILIGTLGGIFVARRVLKRVDAISESARAIMTGDLSKRLPLAGTGDELDRLAENVNAMLERITALMAGLKEVSDNIAHDLKTPLTRLRNGAEQALRARGSPEDQRAALEKIIEESDGLIRIFNALLMIARAEAGTQPEGMSDFDVSEIARDVGELYEAFAEEHRVALTVSAEAPVLVHGNRELVGQALANLLDNALKYGVPNAPDGGAPPPVSLDVRRRDDTVEISVADHGAGIIAADRIRVVDRFVRLENSRTRPGSGLGLSLAAAVAHLHGGELRLEDNAPGLRVIIALPVSHSAPAPLPAPPALQSLPALRTAS